MIHQPEASLLAAVLAAVGVYPINRFTQKRMGVTTLLLASPLWEETIKTLSACLLGSGLFPVHLLFGVIEGVVDWFHGRKNQMRAAVSSVVSHVLFGAAGGLGTGTLALGGNLKRAFGFTVLPFGPLVTAMAISLLVHFIWNYRVARTMQNRCSGGGQG